MPPETALKDERPMDNRPDDLITTTQAEAYANERIIAVLKEVAEIADDNNDFNTFDAVLDMIDGFGMKK